MERKIAKFTASTFHKLVIIMQLNNNTIDYSKAQLSNLDAGVYIRGPKNNIYGVPKFLIIGAQKCGTTAMRRWLSVHPELQTLPLEWNFFDEVWNIETEWPRYIINPYFKIRRQSVRYTFEKSPGYFYKQNQGVPVPDMVHKLMPSGKFILILRDPTERAWSAYKMYKNNQQQVLYGCTLRNPQLRQLAKKVAHKPQHKLTNIKPFLEIINDLLAIAETNEPIEIDQSIADLLLIGHYAEHLKKWFNRFSREQLLVIFLEDFKQEPFLTMEKVLSFLEIELIDYKAIAKPSVNGFWDLEGYHQNYKEMEPISDQAKEGLDSYYYNWNCQLKDLLPELDIPWLR